MFKRILIANRGEIAVRVIRACKEMGISTVAVYSEADTDSLHVQLADQAVCIGKAESSDSYLNIRKIIRAALMFEVDAIHPGYGFLSENDSFAECCRHLNITFIGPSAEAIRKMGDKSMAREVMIKAGIPVIPGSDGIVNNEKEAVVIAERIGYPVIIKASSGGGGKGMRIAHASESLISALHVSQSEADAAFGNGAIYIEKFIDEGRHIEFQILADNYGNTIHLRERECSIQRRYQKLVEETPSPGLGNGLRKKMGEEAIKAARAVGYSNAGTVEFILDNDDNFYFMEMNTRIQVEHPITEMITGVDIVKEQIRIAAGEKLRYEQSDIVCDGHAIECRINAEDPDNNFMPSPGKISKYSAPSGTGIRLDSHVYSGYDIPHNYDSLLAKVIVHANDRKSAIALMKKALLEYEIEGISTTIPFHLEIMHNPAFNIGVYSTKFIEKELNSPKKTLAPDSFPRNDVTESELILDTHGCFEEIH